MAFGNNFVYNPQPAPYQQGYPSINPYMQQRNDFAPVNQPGTIPARYVTGREEAIAAQIIPGDPFVFADFAHGRIYVKQINPQTMAADFIEFVRAQQPVAAPAEPDVQFATQDDIAALKAEIEALRNSVQTTKTNRKVVSADE
jgi:hypothetical protein